MDLEFFIECFGEGIIWILTTIVGAIVAIFNRKEIRRRFAPIDQADKKVKRKNEYTRSPIVEEQVIKRIKEKDINFDENSFKIWVENLFIAFRNACSNKNMNEVRGYLDSNLFEQYQLCFV